VDGLLDDQPHADRCRHVEDDVAPVDEVADDRGRERRVDDQVVGPVAQVGDVLEGALETSSSTSLPAAHEESLGGADEPGPADDERLSCHAKRLSR
jgi:hypothetical protein